MVLTSGLFLPNICLCMVLIVMFTHVAAARCLQGSQSLHAVPPPSLTPHLAAVAMLACARLGAVHSVVFGGFSAESLAQRCIDCRCAPRRRHACMRTGLSHMSRQRQSCTCCQGAIQGAAVRRAMALAPMSQHAVAGRA